MANTHRAQPSNLDVLQQAVKTERCLGANYLFPVGFKEKESQNSNSLFSLHFFIICHDLGKDMK